MNQLDQLAEERSTEQDIENSCYRMFMDLEVLRDDCHVTTKNIEDMKDNHALLNTAEVYIIKARLLCNALKKKKR